MKRDEMHGMVKEFNYLGHVITTDLKDDAIERERRSLSIRANMIARRMLLGLPRFCSASGMFADARTDCFHTTLRKRCASLVRRVRNSSNIVLKMIAAGLDCHYLRHCCDRPVVIPMPLRQY
ncbi:jg5664 [Pararge aegeria aegeria]|uniref:Jg5664 protein n=1 Tax=Pararge aegeria aegeria TaxID=348720 RepID=A0A8S4QRF9_9NEOP|nr:jg5664 [Pararge aegeria aegeria]